MLGRGGALSNDNSRNHRAAGLGGRKDNDVAVTSPRREKCFPGWSRIQIHAESEFDDGSFDAHDDKRI